MDRTHIDRMIASSLLAALLAVAAPGAGTAWSEPAPAGAPELESAPDVEADSTAGPRRPSRVVIHGVVRDANGGPVRGATIRLMSETDTLEVQCDALGKFRGRLTALQGVKVLVRAYGYRDQVRTIRASRSVIQAAFALPPPYPLGWTTVTMAEPNSPCNETNPATTC